MTGKGLPFLVLFALVTAIAPAAGAAPETMPQKCGITPHFDCEVPNGWVKFVEPDYSTKHSRVYGLQMLGPRAPSGAFVRIEADYFSPGNSVHKTAARYIRKVARLNGGIGLPGEKIKPPQPAKFKGLSATMISRTMFDFVRDETTSQKQVTIQEEILVIPVGKGFYVIEYAAPPSLVNEYRPVFERFKESFTMLVK